MKTISELTAEYEQARVRAKGLLAKAEAANRPLESGEQRAVQIAVDHAKDLRAQLDRAMNDQAMLAAIDRAYPGGVSSGQGGAGRYSIGGQILDSEMGRWLTTHRGAFPTGKWTSPTSEIMAATLTEDTASGGDLVIADVRPGILPLPTRRLTIAALLAPGTTESNMVTYMKETTFTNAAAPVAEGAAKPESTLVFDAVSDPVRKIAHWLPVSEEMLEDVPSLRSYLDSRLRLGVQLAEDDQLLNGDGVAPDIQGLLHRTGLATSIARTTETNADVIFAQIAAIEVATGMEVDGIVLNPANWKTIQLTKDADGNYLGGGGPFASPRRPTLWGRSVAVTPGIAAGTSLVGAFATGGAQLFRKGGLRVESTNSHQDFFVKNLVAIRSELREALAVYRPAAFGTVTNLN